jgi:hypothetical protein
VKEARKAKPPQPEPPLRAVLRREEIQDRAGAADLCKRILRAQAMTAAARAKKERQNDGT